MKKGEVRKTIEVSEEDHDWLINNRGAGSVKELVGKVLRRYKELEPEQRFPEVCRKCRSIKTSNIPDDERREILKYVEGNCPRRDVLKA